MNISADTLLDLIDKSIALLNEYDSVDDTHFVYLAQKPNGVYLVGFNCWAYGDLESQNYMSSATLEAVLSRGEWVSVKVTKLTPETNFYDDVFPNIKGVEELITK